MMEVLTQQQIMDLGLSNHDMLPLRHHHLESQDEAKSNLMSLPAPEVESKSP